jgi:hypothetical protein
MLFGRSNNATKQTNDNNSAPKVVPVYLKSAEHGWIPALQLKTYHGKAKVAVPRIAQEDDLLHCPDYSSKKVRFDNHEIDLADYKDGILPMQNVDHHGNLEDYKDMIDLPFMHEVRVGNASTSTVCSATEYSLPARSLFFSATGRDFIQSQVAPLARQAVYTHRGHCHCG